MGKGSLLWPHSGQGGKGIFPVQMEVTHLRWSEGINDCLPVRIAHSTKETVLKGSDVGLMAAIGKC